MSNFNFNLDLPDGKRAEELAKKAYLQYFTNVGRAPTILESTKPSEFFDFAVMYWLCGEMHCEACEVKWDKLSNATGNVCFEIMGRGNRVSGCLLTKSDKIIHVINAGEMYHYLVSDLHRYLIMALALGRVKVVDAGDDKASTIILQDKESFIKNDFVHRLR